MSSADRRLNFVSPVVFIAAIPAALKANDVEAKLVVGFTRVSQYSVSVILP